MAKKKLNDDDIIKKKPTTKDWDRVITVYLRGAEPEDIPAMFPLVDLDVMKIRKKLSLVGAVQQRRNIDDCVIDAMYEVSKEERIKATKDCVRLFNSGADIIEKLLNKYHLELETGKQQGKSIATAYNVDMLMSGVTKIQKGLRVAYGEDEKGNVFEKEPEVLTIEGIDGNKI